MTYIMTHFSMSHHIDKWLKAKECCGKYDSSLAEQQRQLININQRQCCPNQAIKPFGDMC